MNELLRLAAAVRLQVLTFLRHPSEEQRVRWWLSFWRGYWPEDFPLPEPKGWQLMAEQRFLHPAYQAAWAYVDDVGEDFMPKVIAYRREVGQ